MGYSRPTMARLLPHLARYLLVVLLLGVLSPAVGIDLAQAMTHAAQGTHAPLVKGAEQVGPAEHAASVASSDDQAVMADDCSACPGHAADASPCHDQQHHCCPGHLAAYPPLAASLLPMHPLPRDLLTVDRAPQRFSSCVPAGLERPPRPAIA